MYHLIEISDLSAPELDVYARLTEAQLKNKRHPEQGLFIAESPKVIGHGLDAGYIPVSLLMERRLIETNQALLARCGDIPVYTADRAVLEQLTGFALTRSVLCAMRRPKPHTAEEVCQNARRIAVLDGIVDPTNVGAIIRSAAALDMDAVLISPTCCDPLHRRAVRVSMGTVFQIPWARLGASAQAWPQEGLEILKGLGFATAALALDHRAISIDNPQLLREPKLALLLGTEGDGLTPAAIAGCDYTVMIPMGHGVDSLNVAAASAVAFWQVTR